jgi:PBSX family phage terminase large subunit
LLTGSVRSGKTWISLIKWALFVHSCPANYEFLMCGKTITTLKHNCLTVLQDLVGRARFEYNCSQKSGTLYGRQIWLEGANDERAEAKIRGMTLGGAYLDELTLIPQSFYEMLVTRLSLRDAKMYATTNPDSPGHWVKKRVVDGGDADCAVWSFILDDNPFLPKEQVRRIKARLSGAFYDRFIIGKWAATEGLIYPLFANNIPRFTFHQLNEKLIRVMVGVDFGGNKSASVFIAVGFTAAYKMAYALMEDYRPAASENPTKLGEAFVQFVKTVQETYGACHEVFCDSAEQILIRGLRAAATKSSIPVRVFNAKKGGILNRIRLTNDLLGSGRLRISSACPHLIGSLRDAKWDAKSDVDKRLDNGAYEVDPLDAFEYAVEHVELNLRYTRLGGTLDEAV